MILSIASQKGGTGKTSTTISLAAGLARLGKKVLLVDMDSQANSSKVLLHDYAELRKDQTIYQTIIERGEMPIHETSVSNLFIAPSHILLSNTDIVLTSALDHREARLKTELDKIKGHFDHVLIDCPPALSWLTINAFTASDSVMVVVSPGFFELDSIVQIGKVLVEVKEYYNSQINLAGFLFTMSDPTLNSRTSLKLLRQTYPDQVFRTIIPRNTDLRDAHFNRQDVFSFNAGSKSAQAYLALIKEVFHVEEAK